ncbi:hypothetical protein AB0C65_35990 [Nocardia sp. NPDC048505]|uniref:hypothetical protein n=1 Tax=Nocardia sp. NPDC048505 TaxID=3155756 RepID=UPI0033C43D33
MNASDPSDDHASTYRCGWGCGDDSPGHEHFTVIIRQNGRLLGRLDPSGHATSRKVHAAILSRATADRITSQINDADDDLTAAVRRF